MGERSEERGTEASSVDPAVKNLLIQTWLQQRTEWSKAIFTMSSAAIGLVFAGLLSGARDLSPLVVVFALAGLLGFAVAAVSSLMAFRRSAELVHALAHGKPSCTSELTLKRLENIQKASFYLGVVFIALAPTTHVLGPVLARCGF